MGLLPRTRGSPSHTEVIDRYLGWSMAQAGKAKRVLIIFAQLARAGCIVHGSAWPGRHTLQYHLRIGRASEQGYGLGSPRLLNGTRKGLRKHSDCDKQARQLGVRGTC